MSVESSHGESRRGDDGRANGVAEGMASSAAAEACLARTRVRMAARLGSKVSRDGADGPPRTMG